MTITAVCTSCGRRFEAPPEFAGKRVKCKNCGTVFQIQPAVIQKEAEEPSDLDALEQLEKTDSHEARETSQGSTIRSRLIPRDEKKLTANPAAAEIPFTPPSSSQGRANVLYFRYPGARQVDQWLPLGLILLGLMGFAAVVAASRDTADLTWIGFSRFFVFLFFYYALIFPITLAMLRKAGRELHYRPPPNSGLRAFAVYIPAFALSACFWFAGSGSLMGLILGALFGLALSSAALWLLFRLKEEELATSVAYGAGGFLLGAGITSILIVGLNLALALLVSHTQSVKIPTSPLSPGLTWASPAPFIEKSKPARAPVIAQADLSDTPASPIVSALAIDKFPQPINSILRPLSSTPALAIVRNADASSVIIQAWDSATWQPLGTEMHLMSPSGQYAPSFDGQSLSYVDHFPRLCIKTWSFPSGSLAAPRIDLDASMGEPRLLGYCGPNHLMIRWFSPEQAKADPRTVPQSMNIEILNTADPSAAPITFTTESIEPGHAPYTINTAVQRLAIASRLDSGPTLLQYDLLTGKTLTAIPISEIDPNLKVAPTGLAYSPDGKELGALFEYNGGAVLVGYDAAQGGKSNIDLEYPAWPPEKVSTQGFNDNALLFLNPSKALLVYGQAVISTVSSKPVASLAVPGVVGQRLLTQDRIELIVNQSNTKRMVTATLDRPKLESALSPTTEPSP